MTRFTEVSFLLPVIFELANLFFRQPPYYFFYFTDHLVLYNLYPF